MEVVVKEADLDPEGLRFEFTICQVAAEVL